MLNTFRVIVTNAVKYVTPVESYERCVQSAINIHEKKMLRRAEFPFDTRSPASGPEVAD